MKWTLKMTVAVFLSFVSLCLCVFSLIFPAWSQQTLNSSTFTFQGFGLFAFHSTNALTNPFYASNTTLYYADFCASQAAGRPSPNWMLGHGAKFEEILCGTQTTVTQFVMYAAVLFTSLALLASITACYYPTAGLPERTISITTFFASMCLLAVLIIWSVHFQQKLLEIDVIQTGYSQCQVYNVPGSTWSCWFYGYSFWVAIASVVFLLFTTYGSAAGRASKLRQARKEYEYQLAIAIQESAAISMAAHQQISTPAPRRQMALAIQQSREQHELELAIQQSLQDLNKQQTTRQAH